MTTERKAQKSGKIVPKKPDDSFVTLFANLPSADSLMTMPNGNVAIFCEAHESSVQIWDIETGLKLKESKYPPNSYKLSETALMYLKDESETFLQDIVSDQKFCTLSMPADTQFKDMLASKTCKVFAALKDDSRTVYIWDIPPPLFSDGKAEFKSIQISDEDSTISTLAFQNDETLLIGLSNGNVEKWERKEEGFAWTGSLIGTGDKRVEVTALVPVSKTKFVSYKEQIALLQLIDQDLKSIGEAEAMDKLWNFCICSEGTLVASVQNEPDVYFYNFPDLQISTIKMPRNVNSLAVLLSGEVAAICGNDIFLVDSPEFLKRKEQSAEIANVTLLETTRGAKDLVRLMLDYMGYGGFFSKKAKSAIPQTQLAPLPGQGKKS